MSTPAVFVPQAVFHHDFGWEYEKKIKEFVGDALELELWRIIKLAKGKGQTEASRNRISHIVLGNLERLVSRPVQQRLFNSMLLANKRPSSNVKKRITECRRLLFS